MNQWFLLHLDKNSVALPEPQLMSFPSHEALIVKSKPSIVDRRFQQDFAKFHISWSVPVRAGFRPI